MSQINSVRLLTGLTNTELPDDVITDWLTENGNNARLAAADALEVFAGSLTDVQSDDITLSGSKRAATLLTRAARLREQAAEADDFDGFVFDVVGGSACRPELTERSRW